MSELVRPDPPRSLAERAVALREGITVRVVAGAVACVVVAAVAAMALLRPVGPAPDPILPMVEADVAVDGGPLGTAAPDIGPVVHVAGAVHRPGVYALAPGARVADAVAAAGGGTAGAEVHRLNLATRLVDGSRVWVPRRGERDAEADVLVASPESGGAADGAAAADAVVDLNTATAEQLDTLPGVGPATAAAILEWRRAHGRFRSVDDLLDVRGIGEARLESMRSRVRAGRG